MSYVALNSLAAEVALTRFSAVLEPRIEIRAGDKILVANRPADASGHCARKRGHRIMPYELGKQSKLALLVRGASAVGRRDANLAHRCASHGQTREFDSERITQGCHEPVGGACDES
jgi:hypothetical protein